jgi:hypothetical protein
MPTYIDRKWVERPMAKGKRIKKDSVANGVFSVALHSGVRAHARRTLRKTTRHSAEIS